MSTIKRKVNGEWVNILATPATQVFTSNPVLGYPEGTDIEQLFMSQQADIDLLKKNVSWLALHGGGGSGSGGFGGGSGSMSVVFLNPANTLETISSLTWSSSYTSIPIRISATGMTGTFAVSIFVDGNKQTTIRDKKRNEVFWVDKSYLGITANSETTILVSATVTNSEGTESEPTSLSISFPTLKLYTPNAGETAKYSMSSIEKREVSVMTIQYQCNLPGEYRIFYSRGDMRPDSNNNISVNGVKLTDDASLIKFPNMKDPDGDQMSCPPYISVTVRNTGINTATIPLVSQELPVGSDQYYHGLLNADGSNTTSLVPGTYTYSFILQSVDNLALLSSSVSQTFAIVTSTTLTISPVAGAEKLVPRTVNQQATSKISFILYCEGSASADYRVFISTPTADGSFNETSYVTAYDWIRGSAYPSQVTTFELSWNTMFDADHLNIDLTSGSQPVVLKIECTRNGITSAGYVYINVQSQVSSAITSYMAKLSHFCVFDFTPWYTSNTFFKNANASDKERVTPGIIQAFNMSVTDNIYTYRSMGLPGTSAYLSDQDTKNYDNFISVYAGAEDYSTLCTQPLDKGIYGQIRNSINSVAQWRGYNIGQESGKKTLYYALQHHAYAVIRPGTSQLYNASSSPASITNINNWFNNVKRTGSVAQTSLHKDPPNSRGSIEIAYYIDSTISDEHVILQMGYDVINSVNSNEFGFIITPHQAKAFMYSSTVTCTPVDNSFNHIVFTWNFETMPYSTKLYYNGKLAGVNIVDKRPDIGDQTQLQSWNAVWLGVGCNNPGNQSSAGPDGRYTNMNVYTCRMFNVPMNYGEVVSSYINNLAAYKTTTGDELNAPLITSKMLNNNIRPDTEMIKSGNAVTVNKVSIPNVANCSETYNFLSGTFNEFVEAAKDTGGGLALKTAISSLNIPVVVVTSSQWTYQAFTATTDKAINPDNNCTFRYYPAADSGADTNSAVMTIPGTTMQLQGTSTLGYFIKNVELTMPDDIMFQPSFDYLPESSFVLKADVVDSGHFNNAVIGAYINKIAMTEAPQSKLYDTQVYKIKDKMIEAAQLKQIPVNPEKAFKANIEGFPCLFIIDFYNNDNSQHDIRPLGIYSFNLGRGSHLNQGLTWTTDWQYYDSKEQLVPYASNPSGVAGPTKWKAPSMNYATRPYNTYCFEGSESISCGFVGVGLGSDYDQVLIKTKANAVPAVISNGVCTNVTNLFNDANIGWSAHKLCEGQMPPGYTSLCCYDTIHQEYYTNESGQYIPYNSTNVVKLQITPTGYFWSPDNSYGRDGIFWGNIQNTHAENPSNSEMLASFNEYIARKFGYNKAGIIREMGATVPYYEADAASGSIVFKQSERTPSYSIERIQAAERASISFTNIGFYYVICMLFGLTDSFGKNMQYKAWQTVGSKTAEDIMGDAYWTPAFYDMDTALGIDNTGMETVTIDMWDETLVDSPSGAVEFIYGMAPGRRHSFATVYSNKIFGIVTSPVNYTQWGNQGTDCYGPEGENGSAAPYLYSRIWTQLREKYIPDTDTWVDENIESRYESIPELIMNYDYEVKYVSPGTAAMAAFMHGDRVNYIRQWLKKRVYFLDSVFGYYHNYYNSTDDNAQFLPQQDNTKLALYMVPYNMVTRFTYDATDLTKFKIKTSQPLIARVATNSNNNLIYMYSTGNDYISMPANKAGTTTNAIQGWLYNMPLITNIDFHSLLPVSIDPQAQAVKTGSNGTATGDMYSNLTPASPFYSNYGNFSSLRTLDWSSIKSFASNINLSFFQLFKTWDYSNISGAPDYAQLESIDLSNVNIPGATVDFSGPSIPSATSPVPPEEYKSIFKNLISINLRNANIMSVVIPSTSTLTELYVSGSSIQNLTLDGQPLLTQLDLTNCASLTNLTVRNCDLIKTLSIGSECRSIDTVVVENMESLTSLTIVGGDNRKAPTLSVKDCPLLTTIAMTGFTADNGNTECINDDITIDNCPKLTSLDFNNTHVYSMMINFGHTGEGDTMKDKTFREAYPNLRTIDLSHTCIKKLMAGGDAYLNKVQTTDDYDNMVVDLRNIPMLTRLTGRNGMTDKPYINSTDNQIYTSISLYANKAVETVYLSNNKDIPNYSFAETFGACSAMTHIYGYLKCTHGFNSCTHLTFFTGKDDFLYTTNDSQITASGGTGDYKTAPYNINHNGGTRSRFVTEYGGLNSARVTTDGIKFADNGSATDPTIPNTIFNCELINDVGACFAYTKCSLSACYILLWNSPTITGLTSTWYGCSDPSGTLGVYINGSIKRNNTFHWQMFKNNTKLLKLSETWRAASLKGYLPLFSPKGSEPGLFGYAPNLSSISLFAYDSVLVHDNHLFDNNPNLTSLQSFSYHDMAMDQVNDIIVVNTADYAQITNIVDLVSNTTKWVNGQSTFNGHVYKFGNYGGIFRNCKKLNNINRCFRDTRFVDWDCFDWGYTDEDGTRTYNTYTVNGIKIKKEPLGLTSTVTTVTSLFGSYSASGTVNLRYLASIKDDDTWDLSFLDKVQNIKDSFCMYQSIANRKVPTLPMTYQNADKEEDNFALLKSIVNITNTNASTDDLNIVPFSGYKKIGNWNDIKDNGLVIHAYNTLVSFKAMFSGCVFDDENTNVADVKLSIPGEFFKSFSNLKDISSCFYGISFPDYEPGFALSTNMPFKLTNGNTIQYMDGLFARSNDYMIKNSGQECFGGIPVGFMYTGGTTVNVSLSGTDEDLPLTKPDAPAQAWTELSDTNVTAYTAILPSCAGEHSFPETLDESGNVTESAYTLKNEYYFKFTNICKRDGQYFWAPISKYQIICRPTITQDSKTTTMRDVTYPNETSVPYEAERIELTKYVNGMYAPVVPNLKKVFTVSTITYSYFKPDNQIIQASSMFAGNTFLSYNVSYDPDDFYDKVIDSADAFEAYINHMNNNELSKGFADPLADKWKYKLALYTSSAYSPFRYKCVNGNTWSANTSRDANKYTFKWSYDGNFYGMRELGKKLNDPATRAKFGIPTTDTAAIEYQVDDINVEDMMSMSDSENSFYIKKTPYSVIPDGTKLGTTDTVLNYGKDADCHFFCSPELLRYIGPMSSGAMSTYAVQYMFNNCGVQQHTLGDTWNGSQAILNLGYGMNKGINGRIPPHLFCELPGITSYASMFSACKMLSGYIMKDGSDSYKIRIIPQKLFSYCNQRGNSVICDNMFAYGVWPGGTDLNVLSGLAGTSLSAYMMFAAGNWGKIESDGRDNSVNVGSLVVKLPSTVTVSSVFRGINISTATACFAKYLGSPHFGADGLSKSMSKSYGQCTITKNGTNATFNITYYPVHGWYSYDGTYGQCYTGNVIFENNIFNSKTAGTSVYVFGGWRFGFRVPSSGIGTPELGPNEYNGWCQHFLNQTTFADNRELNESSDLCNYYTFYNATKVDGEYTAPAN